MKNGTEYFISRETIIDPGTIRFNKLFPGEFRVTSVRRKGLVSIVYTHYGRFTGKEDAIPVAVFQQCVKNNLFVEKTA